MSRNNLSKQELEARLSEIETTLEHCRVSMSMYMEQHEEECDEAYHVAKMADFMFKEVLREADSLHTEVTQETRKGFLSRLFNRD